MTETTTKSAFEAPKFEMPKFEIPSFDMPKFEVPAAGDFPPLYLAGSAALSYNHTAFELYVALLEPFAVDLWYKELNEVLPEEMAGRTWRKTSYFGGLYQKLVSKG